MADRILDLGELRDFAGERDLTLGDVKPHTAAFRVLTEIRRRQALGALHDALPDAPDNVTAVLEKATAEDLVSNSIFDIVTGAVERAELDDGRRKKILTLLDEAREDNRLFERTDLRPDLPIRDVPELSIELERAKVAEITRVAKLPKGSSEALLEEVPTLGAMSEQRVATLVIEGKIKEQEARRVGAVVGLSQFLAEDVDAVERVSNQRFGSLGRPIRTLTDIFKIDEEELAETLDPKLQEKDPEAARAAAKNLRRQVEARFPSEGMSARLAPGQTSALRGSITAARRVLDEQPDALQKDPESLGLKGAEAAALRDIQTKVNAYPGMGLDKIVTSNLSPQAKATQMNQRAISYEAFVQENADIDLLGLDHTPNSEDMKQLNFEGIDEGDRIGILATVKARARAFHVAKDVETAAALMQAGFHSSMDIAASDPKTIAAKTGLAIEDVSLIYESAERARSDVTNLIGTLVDELRWDRVRTPWRGTAEDVSDGLKQLPGYEDLFGSQSFCSCAHCDSILSPAAYFVDLMTFVDEHVTKREFQGNKANHALKLQIRRPDLWTVPLTCDNTHDLVPTLEIMNEILEAAVAKRADNTIDLNDQSLVRERVYEATLPAALRSFVTPFDLRVATADRYVQDFDTNRAEIQRMIRTGATAEDRNAAALELSLPAYRMIKTARTGWGFLQGLYRMTFARSGSVANPFDVQDIMAGMAISREDFGDLVATAFVTNSGAANIQINAQKRNDSSVQNDIERVSGMSRSTLDRAHRFWRLKTAIGWDVTTLDLALTRAGGGLSDSSIGALTQIRQIAERFDLDVDVVLALVGPISEAVVGHDELSLMDRLFNVVSDGADQTPFPAPTISFIHPGLRDDASLPETGTNAGTFVSQRLRVALEVSDAELLDLIIALAPTLGIDPAASDEADRGFSLTTANLTQLFRHAVLAKALDLDIESLFLSVRIVSGSGAVSNAAQLIELLNFVDALARLPIDLTTFGALMGLVDDPVADGIFVDGASIADGAVADIEQNETHHFAPTVFAFLDGVSEEQSRAIVEANKALFDNVERDMLRLKQGVDLTPAVTAPAGGFPTGVTEADLQAVLDSYNLRTLLPAQLAGALALDEDKFAALATLAGVDFTSPAMIDAFDGGGPLDLRNGVAALSRPIAALNHDAVDAVGVTFIDANRGLFALADPVRSYTRRTVLALAAYVDALMAGADDSDHAASVNAVLLAHTQASGFAAADTFQLATAAGADEATVRIFETSADLPAIPVLALDHLRRIVAFADVRKLGADAMALLASTSAEALGEGAESLLAALQLRIGDPISFESVLDGHQDTLRGLRRNALVDHVIRGSAGRFDDVADLYNYYLIDPEMEGCARTSRVVSATGSLQTYVHRIILNLEQDRRSTNAANHVHVSPTRIPRDEWEWRKNYRVWEANRKVFLWPENYMQPALRDNKTPLFEDLEKTLLQQDINEQTVLDAYAAYLRGFEELASLRIAGAYHEHIWSSKTDILHIFGCTSDDPPVYYYWTIENLTFSKLTSTRRISYSARRKIDVAIGARDVSPIMYNNRLHVFWLERSTAANTEVEDGENKFLGYQHTLKVKYSALRLDGSWTPPQELSLGRSMTMMEGGIQLEGFSFKSSANPTTLVPTLSDELFGHSSYREGYTLRAPAWQKVYPSIRGDRLLLNVGARLIQFDVDMFERRAEAPEDLLYNTLRNSWDINRQALHASQTGSTLRLYEQTVFCAGTYQPASAGAVLDYTSSHDALRRNLLGAGYSESSLTNGLEALNLRRGDLGASIARINDPSARILGPLSNWSLPSLLLQKDSDVSFFSYSHQPDKRPYEARRLGTTVLTDLSRTLFYDGVSGLLDKKTQLQFGEASHLVTSSNYKTRRVGPVDKLDYTGPLGVYFREIFMYIPALLAAHQNARGDYAAAQAWYATIFDPTADFDADIDLGSLSTRARLQAERDRVWQYAEFQGLSPKKLRNILTDEDAQEAYRKDPFNPYAIARLRLSAFQKNIVMRYVENLLDWADSLFRTFQRETVDEAHVLYDMARQILGDRPADVGDCGQGAVTPRTYERIKPHMDDGSDFLIEVETFYIHHLSLAKKDQSVTAKRDFVQVERSDLFTAELAAGVESKVAPEIRYDSARMMSKAERIDAEARGNTEQMFEDDKTVAELPDSLTGLPALEALAEFEKAEARFVEAHAKDGVGGRQLSWKRTGNAYAERSFGRTTGINARDWRIWDLVKPDRFTVSVVKQVGPVFCIPRNDDLLALWDRVEDRLFKIHNCLNIDGERVDLALFAPEIDPNALVRARAAGLSLSDILGAGAGNLPPYRFTYLIAKARDYTGLIQSFGAKLQAAIEKRDAEELATLRISQAINMQNLVTSVRENEMKIAEETLEELNRKKAALEYRRDYYDEQISTDLLSWERTQQILTHTSSISYTASALLSGTAGVLHLIPQLGSPFAMKYGGSELGNSTENWSKMFSDTAKLSDVLSKSASLEAGFQRRRTGWSHQHTLEEHELKQIEKRIVAAEIRVEIAKKARDNHKKAVEDQEEILEFYESKFANQDLYTWLASTLQTIYRGAFNAALSMAQLAEQAYRFERPDDTATLLQPTYWEAGRAGLLSGEKLAVDLVAMEKRYIETNYRTLEIAQPFSMLQLDPGALMALRETGEANVTIPEFAFDLLYPGHYRRRIRSVRLSIACVTGPYVNIPATLTLTGSKMRVEPTLDGTSGLSDSPLRHMVQIATSTAQNDSGVFEFSFSDPRYMPFEGAGAVESSWKITLPKTFRPFNYATINDVILHINYAAESDGILRERVESENAQLEGALAKVLSATPLPRAFSLRQEFSTAFHRLQTNAPGVETILSLDDRAIPLPLRADSINIGRALLLIKLAGTALATGTRISINDQVIEGFAALPDFPGYVGTSALAAFGPGLAGDHRLSIVASGDLSPSDPADEAALSLEAVEDMVLYFDLMLG
ncbi:MAG: neuraminidase-like domain-containing protein [Pseudomonadota bacterium]